MSLQPKSDECLCWLSQRIDWEFFPLCRQKQKCLSMFLISKKLFLAKYLSGRTIELDKVYEPEHNDQSSAASELVSEAATTIMAPMTTKCFSHGDRSTY